MQFFRKIDFTKTLTAIKNKEMAFTISLNQFNVLRY